MNNPKAGRGDPYWYEWSVGLVNVVDMLDTSSGIISVSFQVEGIKGWDDVKVSYSDGTRRFYQVKHTREANNLTFGDLVSADENGDSLLRHLFSAWVTGGLNNGHISVILFTNREAGSRGYTLEGGHYRPPILEFMPWLSVAVQNAKSFSVITPPKNWRGAWDEWIKQLTCQGASDEDRLQFLRCFIIRAGEDDLDGLEENISDKLAQLFGIPLERVHVLIDALHHALKKWTTGQAEVKVEDVYNELSLPAEAEDLVPAPPPPEPFFPSREPIVDKLASLLQQDEISPILFLTAEPGAGKTSLISKLTNRRVDRAFSGLIGLRYFCFEPIRPENPFISPDSGRVRPEIFWFSLLTQLREGLRGRLGELNVPIRNDLLNWEEAREHVLRLADNIGRELGRRFVIVVDGIDHAARAAQTTNEAAARFLESLPSPEFLDSKNICLLIAGQLPEHYPAYPVWLRDKHPLVERFELAGLNLDDVGRLYSASNSKLPKDCAEPAIRLIESVARGNTLATVFAVAEAAYFTNLDDYSRRLDDRHLRDGLEAYYDSIWTYAISAVGDLGNAAQPYLLGAFSIAKQDLSAEMLADAFSVFNQPFPWWLSVLSSLGPLLEETANGFRVRHNDVRLFINARFSSNRESVKQKVLSDLINHYLQPNSNRIAAHNTLFSLLALSARAGEAAKHFTVEWIFEAAAWDIPSEVIVEDCLISSRSLVEMKDWTVSLQFACATQTLIRLLDIRSIKKYENGQQTKFLPPILPSEAFIRPVDKWTTADFSSLLSDLDRLIGAHDINRAKGLFERWLGGLNFTQLFNSLSGVLEEHINGSAKERTLRHGMGEIFENFGRISGLLRWIIPIEPTNGDKAENQAAYSYEKGLLPVLYDDRVIGRLDDLFSTHAPIFWDNWCLVVNIFSNNNRWDFVRQCLDRMFPVRIQLDPNFQALAVYYALRSGAAENNPEWLDPLTNKQFKLQYDRREPFDSYLALARSKGWLEVGSDPADIAEYIYSNYKTHSSDNEGPQYRIALCAAAILGKITGVALRRGWESAAKVVSPDQITMLINRIWEKDTSPYVHYFFRNESYKLAEELCNVTLDLGEAFSSLIYPLAITHAKTYPVDQRLSAIWPILERHGNRELLIKWIQHWLSPTGAIWSVYVDEIEDIMQKLIPRAYDLGLSDVAEYTQNRVKWSRISYIDHKDTSFEDAYLWLRDMIKVQPASWHDLGLKIKYITERCQQQGGDNEYESDIMNVLYTGAIHSGAGDFWGLLLSASENVEGSDWHHTTFHRIANGFRTALINRDRFSLQDKIYLWCLLTCFSRWYDKHDVQSMIMIRNELSSSCSSQADSDDMQRRLLSLTPSEMYQNNLQEDDHSPYLTELEHEDRELSAEGILESIKRGQEILPSMALKVLCAVRDEEISCEDDYVSLILRAIGSGRDYPYAWQLCEGSKASTAIREIVKKVTDDELWHVFSAILMSAQKNERWLSEASENLHTLILARAYERGFSDLYSGLNTILQMHTAWAFGWHVEPIEWPELPIRDDGLDWGQVTVRILHVLLKSRSAEVIGSALVGLNAFVDSDPTKIRDVFNVIKDEWALRWVLIATEAWAAMYPKHVETITDELNRILHHAALEQRLQTWITLCKLADMLGHKRPEFPLPNSAASASEFCQQARLFTTMPVEQGRLHYVDRYHSASNKLRVLRQLGYDFSHVEGIITSSILSARDAAGEDTEPRGPYRTNDVVCSDLTSDHALSDAIMPELTSISINQNEIPQFAQAYLNNEDPWITRSTPLPSPEYAEWPNLDDYSATFSGSDIRARMYTLAMSHALPEGWRTLVGLVYLYSRKEDFILRLWHEKYPDAPGILRVPNPPTTISGRTFAWWLGDCFEPKHRRRTVLGFFVGGEQRLANCTLEIQPSSIWRSIFNWEPDKVNPTRWRKEGRCVAQYQRLHGPFRENNGREPSNRQPIMHRWLVREDEYSLINETCMRLYLREHFEQLQFQVGR